MRFLTQILILLDEYASGERSQKEVADDIAQLIDDSYDEGREAGYLNGYEVGWNDAEAYDA